MNKVIVGFGVGGVSLIIGYLGYRAYKKSKNKPSVEVKPEENQNAGVVILPTDQQNESDTKTVKDILNSCGYSGKKEPNRNTSTDRIKVVYKDDVGKEEGNDKLLIYYSDGILADQDGHKWSRIEIESYILSNFTDYFDDPKSDEPDCIYIYNKNVRMYYTIERANEPFDDKE